MPASKALLVVFALLSAVPISAAADDQRACLTQDQRRAAVAGQKAVPLAKAMRAAKAHVGGEVVRARLCDHGKGLVYVLTVLARDGKVTRADIDAGSGAFLGGR